MLLKEKVFLSNCDSVRALPPVELHKRFLLGLTVANGVVVSPNTLLDNRDVTALLTRRNVVKYLNEEGAGQLVVRGFNFSKGQSLVDYFDGLPPDYIVSSVDGSPLKSQLTTVQSTSLLAQLRQTDQALNALQPNFRPVQVQSDSLQREIVSRLQDPSVMGHFFAADGDLQLFLMATQGISSRSQWYKFTNQYFSDHSRFAATTPEQFRLEVVDPAYHSLFVDAGDGFLQDKIKHLSGLPKNLLDAGLTLKSLRNEIALLEVPFKLFKLVSSLGASELLKFIADEAIDYVEEKATAKGLDFATRKNWFGLYPKMRQYIGLEIKK